MNEDFVTFEVAKKLKCLGFNEPFFFFYREDYKDKKVHHVFLSKPLIYGGVIDDKFIIAPTISQVLKWLREEKEMVVSIHPHYHYGKDANTYWSWDAETLVYKVEPPTNIKQNDFGSYEQAALAGIEYILDNFI